MVSEKDTLKSLYEIQMRTPVGIKQGTLKVEILNSQISGYLNIMQQTEPFYGYIDKN